MDSLDTADSDDGEQLTLIALSNPRENSPRRNPRLTVEPETIDRVSGTGRRLTATERSTLVHLARLYRDVKLIRLMLDDDYPDFPDVTDQTIREYRRKADSPESAQAKASEAEALTTGIADKATRLSGLNLIATTCLLNIRKKVVTVDPLTGQTNTTIVLDYNAMTQYREIAKLAGQEVGVVYGGTADKKTADGSAVGMPAGDADEEELIDSAEALAALYARFEAYQEQQAAESAARAASQPPEGYEL